MGLDSRAKRLSLVDSALSIGQWIWSKGAAFLASATGATLIGYLASATAWIDQWGPVAWGLIGLLAFVLLLWSIAGAQFWLATAKLKRAQARIAERSADTALINPLDSRYLDKRIALYDLRSPMGEPVAGRVFEKCELIGPAVIVLIGNSGPAGSFQSNELFNVELVKVQDTAISAIPNKIILSGCNVINCKIYNVLFLVPNSQIPLIDQGFGGTVRWLN